jgi:lysyl-tRNA synthetase class 1
MEDYDDLEERYFSVVKDPNPMKDAKQRGLYEYTMLLAVPKTARAHVPYRLLAQLAAVAPKSSQEEYVARRLVAYGMVKEASTELRQRIAWAVSWAGREGKTTPPKTKLDAKTRKAVREFAEEIQNMTDPNLVQNAAFESLKRNGLNPSGFFPAVYGILLGSDRGPRLGPYVIDAGPRSVSEALLHASRSK